MLTELSIPDTIVMFIVFGRIRNLALTKKLTHEFCLFFTDMTYVLKTVASSFHF